MSSYARPPRRQREQTVEESTAPSLVTVNYPSSFDIPPSSLERALARAFWECEKNGPCPISGWKVSAPSISSNPNVHDGVSQILSILFEKQITLEQVTNKPVLGSPIQCVSVGVDNPACKYSVVGHQVITVPGNMTSQSSTKTSEVRTRMLTRTDIFPPTVPIYEIAFTNVAVYSSTPLEVNAKMVERIGRMDSISSLKEVDFFDGTACVGGDSVNTIYNWTRSFPGQGIKVEACEMNHVNFLCLKENVNLFGYSETTSLHNADTTSILIPQSKLKNSPHVIFFDPPWGGRSYKDEKSVRLMLGEYEIFDLVKRISDNSKEYPDLRLIVVKSPYNMEMSKQWKELTELQSLTSDNFGLSSGSKIVYHFVDVNKIRSTNLISRVERQVTPLHSSINKMSLDEYLNGLTTPDVATNSALKISKVTTESEYENEVIREGLKIPSLSWVTMNFLPGIIPLVDSVGKIPAQTRSYIRLYFFAQKLTYEKLIACLFRFLWRLGDSARLSFMTNTLLIQESTKIQVIVVDLANDWDASLQKTLSTMLSVRVNESVLNLLDIKTGTLSALSSLSVYSPVYNIELETEGKVSTLPIMASVKLPLIKLTDPIDLLPSDKNLGEVSDLEHENLGQLLLPKIITQKKNHIKTERPK